MWAPERWESFGCWGKACEWLTSSESSKITGKLVIPVEFEEARLNGLKRSIPDSFRPYQPSLLWPLDTTTTERAGQPVFTAIESTTSAASNAKLDCQFLRLPNEIIVMITGFLGLDCLYTLSSCSKQLRVLLYVDVHTRFRRQFAPWANTPLVNLGSYAEEDPPGITLEVLRGWHSISNATVLGVQNEYGTWILKLQSKFPVQYPNPAFPLPPACNEASPNGASGFSSLNRFPPVDRYFPEGQRWLLRNLSKREFVYAAVLSSNTGLGIEDGGQDCPYATNFLGFDLGALVAARTCWSSERARDTRCLDVWGQWAGDRLDIVTFGRFQREIKKSATLVTVESSWKDVSWEAWKEMFRLCLRDAEVDGRKERSSRLSAATNARPRPHGPEITQS